MKRKQYSILAALMAASMILSTGCQNSAGSNNATTTVSTDQTVTVSTVEGASDAEDNRQEIKSEFKMTTEDGSFSVEGNIYTITAAGTYEVTGALSEGRIVVKAGEEDKVEIVLSGASITCSTAAPICILSAGKAEVKSKEDTFNEIIDNREHKSETNSTGTDSDDTDEDGNAAIYATCDLKLTGKGSLVITANYNNGVQSKDDLTVKNVTLHVTAYNHGIKGNDILTVESGNLIVETTKGDGLKTSNAEVSESGKQKGVVTIEDGSISISAADDGIHAESELVINGGTIQVPKSVEGLEGVTVTINGGTIVVYASDDGINACTGSDRSITPTITINGGTVDVTTPNGDTDGIDSNGNYNQTGGYVIVKGGASMGSMAGSIDVDGKITVTGGTTVAIGGICELPEESVNTYSENGTSITTGSYTLTNASGETVLSFDISGTYSSFWIASAQLTTGTAYTLSKDGSSVSTWTQEEGTMGTSQGFGGFGGGFGGGGFGGGGKHDNFSGERPTGDFSGEMPSGDFSGEMPSGDFSGEMPSGGFPGEMPSGGFPGEMPSGGFPGNQQDETSTTSGNEA